VLACYRYIELHPVRVGLATHPRQYPRRYPWSSYRVNAEGMPSDLIAPHEECLAPGRCNQSYRLAYLDLFDVSLDTDVVSDIRASTNSSFAPGNERFKQEISTMLNRRGTPTRAGMPSNEGIIVVCPRFPRFSRWRQSIGAFGQVIPAT
jgi:putative transposase